MRVHLMALLGVSALGCATPGPAVDPAEPTRQPDVVERAVAEVHAPGGGGRPVELDYKEEREHSALLGLSYGTGEAGRVTVDPGPAARILAAFEAGHAADQAGAEFERGRALYARNARLEAIAAHTAAVLLAPGEARMYEGLGDALRAERFESRAEAAYRTGIDLGPSAELHTKLSEVLWMRSEREAAIGQALRAIAFDPDAARASANLARWYYFTHDHVRAWEYVHRCERLGASLPAQLRPLLASHMPEPRR